MQTWSRGRGTVLPVNRIELPCSLVSPAKTSSPSTRAFRVAFRARQGGRCHHGMPCQSAFLRRWWRIKNIWQKPRRLLKKIDRPWGVWMLPSAAPCALMIRTTGSLEISLKAFTRSLSSCVMSMQVVDPILCATISCFWSGVVSNGCTSIRILEGVQGYISDTGCWADGPETGTIRLSPSSPHASPLLCLRLYLYIIIFPDCSASHSRQSAVAYQQSIHNIVHCLAAIHCVVWNYESI